MSYEYFNIWNVRFNTVMANTVNTWRNYMWNMSHRVYSHYLNINQQETLYAFVNQEKGKVKKLFLHVSICILTISYCIFVYINLYFICSLHIYSLINSSNSYDGEEISSLYSSSWSLDSCSCWWVIPGYHLCCPFYSQP